MVLTTMMKRPGEIQDDDTYRFGGCRFASQLFVAIAGTPIEPPIPDGEEECSMVVQAIVEIPQGSQNKCKYDPATGRIGIDRVLSTAMHYPANYGCIPDTWADDNDPLDVLIFCSTSLDPGVEVAVRVIGAFFMADEHGPDTKIIGVAQIDPRFDHVQMMANLGSHLLREVRHFFQEYNALQGIVTAIGDFHQLPVAVEVIEHARRSFGARRTSGD